ncbi:oligosaccharide flippase family protein [Wenxinia saemankumensis]|uniref:Membrane protein involved in the export of O-antigen and teichoic acid n=1 Tax=Wenxinia saemankumensis TaxID=1447782 RepID=A0A1M6FZX3_9RHOB|nr:oligosaccharide flippase family protein [Wenxinia saemankumensis]SHJ03159.1 Membrane protein involved in the export of O-antigen and teichoic acid [Wenxinia saemankumensis]
MIALRPRFLSGSGLVARAARSSLITFLGFGGGQALRLASNLVLTRLLFPEAFGLMALVTVVLIGLGMFSDVGIGPSIMSSKRGDDPDFLDTAWTIQILRGLVLFAAICALAWPVAQFYREPALLALLPAMGGTLIVDGFRPTAYEVQNRHLRAGLVTAVELAIQAIGVAVAILFAWAWGSVWALVVSGYAASLANVVLATLILPGPRNRLRWESAAAHELVHFGKWIFLSTVCGFFIMQADKLILGRALTLENFGVYSIGYFLASFPIILGGALMRRLVIPVYRESPPAESRANALRVRRMRAVATAGLGTLLLAVAALGPWLVRLMYDDRYEAAAGIVTAVAAAQIPVLIMQSCDQAALAYGDSRRFFRLTLVRAVATVAGIVAGLFVGGLLGAACGMALAGIAVYPVLAWLNRPHGAWDPVHDAGFFFLLSVLAAIVLWYHRADLLPLLQMGHGLTAR